MFSYTDNKPRDSLVNIVGCHCNCKDICTVENNCPCLVGDSLNPTQTPNFQGRQYCEKYCQCQLDCKKRFLGCNCKSGNCNTKNCACYATKVECNPDTCRTCAANCVIIAPKVFGTSNTCKNLKIQMRK